MGNAEIVESILAHHGVKGMKWGVRRDRANSSSVSVVDKKKKLKTYGGKGLPAHSDAVNARTLGQVGKKSGLKALSNAELRAYNERLNLEQNAKRLKYEDSSMGRKWVLGAMRQTGKTSSQDLSTEASKHIKRGAKFAGKAALAAL